MWVLDIVQLRPNFLHSMVSTTTTLDLTLPGIDLEKPTNILTTWSQTWKESDLGWLFTHMHMTECKHPQGHARPGRYVVCKCSNTYRSTKPSPTNKRDVSFRDIRKSCRKPAVEEYLFPLRICTSCCQYYLVSWCNLQWGREVSSSQMP